MLSISSDSCGINKISNKSLIQYQFHPHDCVRDFSSSTSSWATLVEPENFLETL